MDNPAAAQPEAPRLAYSVDDFAELIGIGRTKVYEEIRLGRLQAKKLGSRTLIPADAVRAYFAQLPDYRAAA